MKATLRKIDSTSPASARPALLPAEGTTLQLSRQRGASVEGAYGWRVRALRGTVWITHDGDIRDIVLEAGQEHVFDRATPAMLWTLDGEGACLVLRPKDRAPQPRSAPQGVGHPVFA